MNSQFLRGDGSQQFPWERPGYLQGEGELAVPPPVTVFFDGRIPLDLARRIEKIRAYSGVSALALMPDAHIAGPSAVGLVVSTTNTLYPALVGEDIGCGMASLRLVSIPNLSADAILSRLQQAVPIHRHKTRRALPDLGCLSNDHLSKQAARDGAIQFATLGQGNHFLELQCDTEGDYWLTVHTGSRAMGAAVTAPVYNKPLHLETVEAQSYLHDQHWCRRYAHASRLAILKAATTALEATADPTSLITCDHNHISVEAKRYIHRKGATPAHASQSAIIAGSMGTRTFHVEGRGYAPALYSASHGAGRRLTRTEARQQISVRDLRRQMGSICYDLRLERSLVEEAPTAYRDIRKVLRAQHQLIKLIRELRPLVVHKG